MSFPSGFLTEVNLVVLSFFISFVILFGVDLASSS